MTRQADKPLVWLSGEVKSPPFSMGARLEAGFLLRRLQRGERLEPPHSKVMGGIGRHCHELRVPDAGVTWRLIYRIDPDAIVLVEVFAKKTARTPKHIIENCRRRLKRYDEIAGEAE
jgi:phage-related protein